LGQLGISRLQATRALFAKYPAIFLYPPISPSLAIFLHPAIPLYLAIFFHPEIFLQTPYKASLPLTFLFLIPGLLSVLPVPFHLFLHPSFFMAFTTPTKPLTIRI
jgi:hypothetical protein